jgi:hypothetical protein
MTLIAKPKPTKAPKGKKRKKKTERQLLEIRLDALVKEIVLQRDNGCVCPPPEHGHSRVRQPGHLFTRGHESIKWDLYNVHEQCSSCNGRHVYHTKYYRWWFVDKFGEDELNRLDRDARQSVKMSIDDLETLEYELTEIQKMMEDGWKPYFSQKDILAGRWKK